MDKLWNAQYWADRLQETTEQAADLRSKLNTIPFEPLTYEDQFRLRETLNEYRSYSHLLSEDMAQPDPARPPLWKRMFHK